MSYITDKDPMIIAEEAKQLLDNPIFVETFNDIEKSIVDSMKQAPIIGNPDAEAYRDKLILSLQAIESIKQTITSLVDTGRINLAFNKE